MDRDFVAENTLEEALLLLVEDFQKQGYEFQDAKRMAYAGIYGALVPLISKHQADTVLQVAKAIMVHSN
jgi:hypothetical protein